MLKTKNEKTEGILGYLPSRISEEIRRIGRGRRGGRIRRSGRRLLRLTGTARLLTLRGLLILIGLIFILRRRVGLRLTLRGLVVGLIFHDIPPKMVFEGSVRADFDSYAFARVEKGGEAGNF